MGLERAIGLKAAEAAVAVAAAVAAVAVVAVAEGEAAAAAVVGLWQLVPAGLAAVAVVVFAGALIVGQAWAVRLHSLGQSQEKVPLQGGRYLWCHLLILILWLLK